MKHFVLAVKDLVADNFGIPQFVPAVATGTRAFQDAINSPQEGNMLYLHPDDFDLHLLGTYDATIGDFDTSGPPRLIIRGRDCKKPDLTQAGGGSRPHEADPRK